MKTHPAATVISLTAAGILALAALAGCSSGGTPPAAIPSTTAPSAARTSPATAFNSADVTFARSVVTLDQQSTALTGLVAGHTSRAELRTMAARMDGDYGRYASQARGWMHDWAQPLPSPSGSPWRDSMGPGMMNGQDWNQMGHMYGQRFDSSWTDAAIAVNTAAIAACRAELAHGISPQARALAQQMLTARQADLAQLHSWHDSWAH